MTDVDVPTDFFHYAGGYGHTTLVAMGVAAYLVKHPHEQVIVFVGSMPSTAHVRRRIEEALIERCGDCSPIDRVKLISVASQRVPVRMRCAAVMDNHAVTTIGEANADEIDALRRRLKERNEEITRLEIELRNLSADAARNAPLVQAAKRYADALWQEKRDEIKRIRDLEALPDDVEYKQDQAEWREHMAHTSERAWAEVNLQGVAGGAPPTDVQAYYDEQSAEIEQFYAEEAAAQLAHEKTLAEKSSV